MKKEDFGVGFRIAMTFFDTVAIVLSFLFAYLIRIYIDTRPYYFEAEPYTFTFTIFLLFPVWLIILALFGLYKKDISLGRSRLPEIIRLFFASIIGTMTIITYDFFYQDDIFPVRPIAIVATILCFLFLCLFRGLLRRARTIIFRKDQGTKKVVIIGNNQNTERLITHLTNFPEDGFSVVGVISTNRFIPDEFRKLKFSSLKKALENSEVDVIFQTDEQKTEYVYNQSVKHHLDYYFVPSEAALSSQIGSLELIGETPVISVPVTPLMGGARVGKRIMDIVLSAILLILTSPLLLVVYALVKVSDPRAKAIYSEYRLSRFNQKVKIYKFRTMYPEFSGLSPEQAFRKMHSPRLAKTLAKKYRKNGDFLSEDPRITPLGHFLRRWSLDELPQLWNVLKGDISLVGPRALVPGELKSYGDRSLLLSVKSGLTGRAQVSGRRDISFKERRALDLYYVQNWSYRMDFQILLQTIGVVITGKGAR